MRRSEISGLKWKDIDLVSRIIKVSRAFHVVKNNLFYSDLKTDRSRRAIAIDPETNALLIKHLADMKDYFKKFEEPLTAESPVFTFDLINPIRPDTLTQTWARIRNELKLPKIRLHDLRHTTASLLLGAGVPIGDVSDRLGHATEGFTLNQYRHAVPGSQERAAKVLSKLLAEQKPNNLITLEYES